MPSFTEFVTEMARHAPEDARVVGCQFRGDPYADITGKWRARVLSERSPIDEEANVYACVSAMRRNEKGEIRRRKDNFAGGLLLMIDDLGTGPGAKFPMSTLDPLAPTCLVETSPDNYQALYFFDRAVEDIELFDGMIRSLIDRQFLGHDPGQAGVNRVFRPPFGVNGKPKYGGWRVRAAAWHPERRYAPDDILRAFDLRIIKNVRAPRDPGTVTAAKAERIRAFIRIRADLRSAGMLKREEPDLSGWIPVHCPWTGEHSGGADNGAAIREPANENEWFGAFRCHHGHCEGRGLRDLTSWIAEEQAEILEMINEAAPEFTDLCS